MCDLKMLLISCALLIAGSSSCIADEPDTQAAVGQDPTPQQAAPIDFDRARQFLQKRNRGEQLSTDEQAYLQRAMEARRQMQQSRPQPGSDPRVLPANNTSGLKPMDEMSAEDRYEDQDGGLYGHGRNNPPPELRRLAIEQLKEITPLDANGMPSPNGKIVLVSISMSNATQEFSRFKQIADADPDKSSHLTIVDCAQGGQAMAEWVSPEAQPWNEAMRRLERAGVTPQQVQVAWIKLANKGPRGDLKTHGEKLQSDTAEVIKNAKAKFPNLRIVYLGSRIYGGYSRSPLNPEPYAYESAFVVRWLIQGQVDDRNQSHNDSKPGDEPASVTPVLLWGPYLWGDGLEPRKSDGLTWERDDFAEDGTHPSQSGRDKVAKMLLTFFKDDPLARSWFLGLDVESPQN